MSVSLFKSARMQLGTLKRRLFRCNQALWFCGSNEKGANNFANQIRNSLTGFAYDMDFEHLERSIDWIKKLSEEGFSWTYDKNEIEAAKKWGHVYPLLLIEGRLAGYFKIALTQAYVGDFEGYLMLKDDEAFVCDTFIHPDFRGQGLSTVLVGETMKWLHQNGYTYLFCHIPAWNVPSRKLFNGLGLRQICPIKFVRIGSWKYFTVRPEQAIMEGRRIEKIEMESMQE